MTGQHRVFVRTTDTKGRIPSPEDLQAYFGQFGDVQDVYKPKGKHDMAYISLGSAEEVGGAVVDTLVEIAGVPVEVKVAEQRTRDGGMGARSMNAPMGMMNSPMGLNQPMGPMGGNFGSYREDRGFAGPPSRHGGAAGREAEGANRIYVTGLGGEGSCIDESQLAEYFGCFGQVQDVYQPEDKGTGQKKPFAFVKMNSPAEVDAILVTPTHTLGSVEITTTAATPRDGAGKSGGMGGPSPRTGSMRGGGMQGQRFASPGLMMQPMPVMSSSRAQQFQARPLPSQSPVFSMSAPAQRSGGPGGKASRFRVFVYGMPPGLNADMLLGHFSRHGEVTDIYLPPKTPDLAYVSFTSEEEVQDALMHSGIRIAGFSVAGVKEADARPQAGRRGARAGPY